MPMTKVSNNKLRYVFEWINISRRNFDIFLSVYFPKDIVYERIFMKMGKVGESYKWRNPENNERAVHWIKI